MTSHPEIYFHSASKSALSDVGTRFLSVNVCTVGTFSVTLLLSPCLFIKGVLGVSSSELGLVFCFCFLLNLTSFAFDEVIYLHSL